MFKNWEGRLKKNSVRCIQWIKSAKKIKYICVGIINFVSHQFHYFWVLLSWFLSPGIDTTGVFCSFETSSSESERVAQLFFLTGFFFFPFRLSIQVWSVTYCICHRKSEMYFNHKIQWSTWWKTVISSFYRFVCQSRILAPWVVLSLLRKVFGLSWCWYIQFFGKPSANLSGFQVWLEAPAFFIFPSCSVCPVLSLAII